MEDQLNYKLITFFEKYKHKTYTKGDMIIRGDDEPTGIYFIKKGYAKMSLIQEDGVEVSINIFKANTFFPMIWALGNVENVYYYKALTSIELYKAPKEDFLFFLKENPQILLDLTSRVLIGIDSIIGTTTSILKANSVQKVAIVIKMLAKRFGKINNEGETEIDISTTHQDIANFSGISRETASLAISTLRKNRVIKNLGRKIIISNLQSLDLKK